MIEASNLLLPVARFITGNPEATEEPTDKMKTKMNVTHITANIGRGVGERRTYKNVNRLSPHSLAVIGFQEIDEADSANEHRILSRIFGKTHTFSGFGTRTPIAVPKKFRIQKTRVKKLSNGVPNQSPARMAVSVVLEAEGRRIHPFVVINSHAPRRTPQLEDERRQWVRGMRKEIKRYHNMGYTVLISCDPNGTTKNLHPDIKWYYEGNIDALGVVEGNVNVRKVKGPWRKKMYIDNHDAHLVRYELRNK